jgi:hypothetical protein
MMIDRRGGRTMHALVLALILMSLNDQTISALAVSQEQKQEFIQLLKRLPTKGEFFTDDGAKEAGPFINVLFALSEQDIENYDLYPFLAISRALSEDSSRRELAIRNFTQIRHRKLKLFWAAILLDEGSASPFIEKFLRDALTSSEEAIDLSEMIGPRFDAMKKKLRNPDRLEPIEQQRDRLRRR